MHLGSIVREAIRVTIYAIIAAADTFFNGPFGRAPPGRRGGRVVLISPARVRATAGLDRTECPGIRFPGP